MSDSFYGSLIKMIIRAVEDKGQEEGCLHVPHFWSQIFGNARPVEIEIGCGKGNFLQALALRYPQINFVGVDKSDRWLRNGRMPEAKSRLSNLRFVRMEAREFLKYCLPESSVSSFHIYFPDPWPKRRHRRRRLFKADFLGLLHNRLRSGGFVHHATDQPDYFLEIKMAVAESGLPWKSCRESVNRRLVHETVQTIYETKYQALGRPLYYLELQKS